MKLGVHEQYQGPKKTTPAETKKAYPHAVITREFKSGLIKPQNLVRPFRELCDDVLAAGLDVAVSFKFDPVSVSSGEWLPNIQQLGRYLVDNRLQSRVILIPWHEPEDDAADSFPLGSAKREGKAFRDGAHFVRYFNTINGWLKQVSPLLQTSHAALGYGYRPKRGGPGDDSAWVTDPAAWVTNADIHSVDLYSGRSFPLETILPDMPAFVRWYASRPKGAPWGLSERGWTAASKDYATRARAIEKELRWLKELPAEERPAFYCIWLTEGVENDQGLKPDGQMWATINAGFADINTPPPPVVKPEAPLTKTCTLCGGAGVIRVETT